MKDSKEVMCCYCQKPASQAEADLFKTTGKKYWVCSDKCEKMKAFVDIFLDAIEELYKDPETGTLDATSFNDYAIDQKIEEIKLRRSFEDNT